MLIPIRYSSRSANAAPLKARILTISTYATALKTWHLLLEAHGYESISLVLIGNLEDVFDEGPFDVIVLGQSVDDTEKKKLVELFRQRSSAPIISVPSRGGDPIDDADFHTEPDPEELLNVIAKVVQSRRGPRLVQTGHEETLQRWAKADRSR